jgi:Cdc6-like AAA superfamily ATPase
MKTITPSSLREFEVPADQLRWRCLPASLGVRTIDEVKPLKEIIGQDRALRALRMGLEMTHSGYNIFVTGHPGTGRTTTIKRLLHEFEGRAIPLTDKCYVHNFRDSDAPMVITLPAGKGAEFKRDVGNFLSELLKSVPAVFESRRG